MRRFKENCFHCVKKGHRVGNCYKLKRKETKREQKRYQKKQITYLNVQSLWSLKKDKETKKKVRFTSDVKFEKPMKASIMFTINGE